MFKAQIESEQCSWRLFSEFEHLNCLCLSFFDEDKDVLKDAPVSNTLLELSLEHHSAFLVPDLEEVWLQLCCFSLRLKFIKSFTYHEQDWAPVVVRIVIARVNYLVKLVQSDIELQLVDIALRFLDRMEPFKLIFLSRGHTLLRLNIALFIFFCDL